MVFILKLIFLYQATLAMRGKKIPPVDPIVENKLVEDKMNQKSVSVLENQNKILQGNN